MQGKNYVMERNQKTVFNLLEMLVVLMTAKVKLWPKN